MTWTGWQCLVRCKVECPVLVSWLLVQCSLCCTTGASLTKFNFTSKFQLSQPWLLIYKHPKDRKFQSDGNILTKSPKFRKPGVSLHVLFGLPCVIWLSTSRLSRGPENEKIKLPRPISSMDTQLHQLLGSFTATIMELNGYDTTWTAYQSSGGWQTTLFHFPSTKNIHEDDIYVTGLHEGYYQIPYTWGYLLGWTAVMFYREHRLWSQVDLSSSPGTAFHKHVLG